MTTTQLAYFAVAMIAACMAIGWAIGRSHKPLKRDERGRFMKKWKS